MLADLYDALSQNTRASGQWGKKGAPKIPPYPRPRIQPKGEKPRVSVKTLHATMSRR